MGNTSLRFGIDLQYSCSTFSQLSRNWHGCIGDFHIRFYHVLKVIRMQAFLLLCKAAFLAPLILHFWAAVAANQNFAAASVLATGALALLSPGGELCGSVITAIAIAISWFAGHTDSSYASSAAGSCALVFALSLALKRTKAQVKAPSATPVATPESESWDGKKSL